MVRSCDCGVVVVFEVVGDCDVVVGWVLCLGEGQFVDDQVWFVVGYDLQGYGCQIVGWVFVWNGCVVVGEKEDEVVFEWCFWWNQCCYFVWVEGEGFQVEGVFVVFVDDDVIGIEIGIG